MNGEKAAVAITDPPYNVRVRDVSGLGRVQHREFAMASGEMTAAQYVAFLDTVMGQLVKNSANGSIHYLFIDWRHVCELLTAGRARYDELKNICVWVKANAGMGSFYRSQHELIAVFKNGTDAHTNNIELGQHGRNRSNVWHYAGVNGFRAGRMDDLAAHPTVKPVAMLVDAIKDCSRRGGLIVDCFAGSGTTVIAAERTGRRAFAMEIDPVYVDVAVRRWQKWTGRDAVLASSNATFDEVAAARACDAETPPVRATKSRIGA
jgi:DNA modification methylase